MFRAKLKRYMNVLLQRNNLATAEIKTRQNCSIQFLLLLSKIAATLSFPKCTSL